MRFRNRFPDLLGQKYARHTHKFKFTRTQRAEASCRKFVEGLGIEEEVWYPEALHADPVLRFYKGCAKWKKQVDKNPDTYEERRKFENSPIFEEIRRNVQGRLGLENLPSVEMVELIYMTCAFETSWNPDKTSPWCALFDDEDLERMQYRQDIEYWWVDGYGHELTYKQACPAVKDLVEHFIAKVQEPQDSPSIVAYFSHSGTLLKLISRFGLFNDTNKLLHSNYHLHKDRQWRTSEIDKFATNLGAVLYKCSSSHEEDYRVSLLFQEQPIPVPGCGNDLCPLTRFVELYDHVLNDCDVPKMCEV